MFYSVWRPLHGPLKDSPLALCDLQSTVLEDYVQLDEVHPTDTLESQLLLHSKNQRWCFLSDQQPNELLIFKAADSENPGEGMSIILPSEKFLCNSY